MKALILQAEWKPRPGYELKEREKRDKRALRGSNIWSQPSAQVEEVPTPEAGPDEVLIRVKVCGVCGSDFHLLETDTDGYMAFPGHSRYPSVPGHEFSGQVEEVGKDVQTVSVGDMVTAESMNWCGVCIPCRMGMVNQCQNLEELGFTVNGAFAEYVVAKEKYCYCINGLKERYSDEEKAYEAGALIEPTAVAYNGIFTRAGGFKSGGHVVIFGAGPIGLAAIALTKTSGAAKIIVFETAEARAKLAEEMGADHVYNPVSLVEQGSSPHEVVMELTEEVGGAMVVEAAGNPVQTMPEMEESVAINGRVAAIGMFAGKTPLDLVAYQKKGAHLHGTQGHSGHDNFPSVIRLMAAGRIDMTRAVADRFSLDDARQAIISSGKAKKGKVLVKP